MNPYTITYQPTGTNTAAREITVQASSFALALLEFDIQIDEDGQDWWAGAEILAVRKVEVRCPHCGRKYADYDTYCMYCGYIRYQAKKGY